MLPPNVEARVAAIASDLDSGASELSLRALEAFEDLISGSPSVDTLKELAAKLEAAQPNMASVRNVAHLCARLIAGSTDAAIALREVRRELTGAHEKIARNALKVISGKPTIVTLSRSLAVVSTLKFLHSRRMLRSVYVLESLPGGEGRRIASQLSASGISTQLAADTQAASVVRRCDLALTGADTVLLDGTLVNKVGTRDLALAANVAGKPFYGACETMKIDSLRTAETFSPAAVRPADALPGDRRGVVLFDLTPPKLVKSFITDQGVYAPHDIARVWAL